MDGCLTDYEEIMKKLLQCPHLTPTECKVGIALILYNYTRGEVVESAEMKEERVGTRRRFAHEVSYETIAQWSGAAKSTILKIVKNLDAHGFLQAEQGVAHAPGYKPHLNIRLINDEQAGLAKGAKERQQVTWKLPEHTISITLHENAQ